MKLTVLVITGALVLAGCGGSPVKTSFPDAPPKLMDPPAELKVIGTVPLDSKPEDGSPSETKLSTVSKIVTDNYTTCNVIREQVIGLQSWITEQKRLAP